MTRAEVPAELQEGFASFVEAARRLESNYADLRRRAEAVDRELAETNGRLEATLAEREVLFDALPIGVTAFDRSGQRIWGNSEGERLDGELGDHGTSVLEAVSGVRQLGESTWRLERVELPNGGTLVLGEDRSRIAHLEREVDRLDRLAGLSELALGVAHEIKNPLNGVCGYASLLGRARDLETAQRFGGRVLEGLQQVDGIVREMLAFARPGDRPSADAPLTEVVDTAARDAGLAAGSIPVGGEIEARVDAVVLTRVLSNLFRNSVEAQDGGVSLSVEAVREPRQLVLIVSDRGPGVPEGLRQRVFEPFVSGKTEGTGLGLALTARVLSFLGGRVTLEDSDLGARFRIELPERAPATEGTR